MAENYEKKKARCGFFNVVWGRKSWWQRRKTSTGSLPATNANHATRFTSTPALKNRKNEHNKDKKWGDRIIDRSGPNYTRPGPNHDRNGTGATRSQKGHSPARKLPQPALGISGELESMITDHQKSNRAGLLIRASSSNVMLHGNLGNLRQLGNNGNAGVMTVLDYLPKAAKEENAVGNVVKKREKPQDPAPLCRALSTRMDPEQLKILGNEDYKNGRFAEAIALYDAAIFIDKNKASYRSNKSAALFALGKLLEAGFECREAIRIDPFYQRAHNRLAAIYIRLGEAQKAVHHFKQSGPEADPDAVNNAKKVASHLDKCTEAKRRRDWSTVLQETSLAIAAGADSAPLIFGLKAEALLKLSRQEEAIQTMDNGPNFDIDDCTKFFGPIGTAMHLVYRAQVEMAAGRFDAAIATAQRASKLDPNSKEANVVLRRTKGVAISRANGNDLYKACRFSEACIAYGEGLGHDPYNVIVLCNRAACRLKLRQYEKAIEDCNSALRLRSSYAKARQRRADCYAKIGKWEACLQDCEVLVKGNLEDDEDVRKMMDDAKGHLMKQDVSRDKNTAATASKGMVSRNENFRNYVTSQGRTRLHATK